MPSIPLSIELATEVAAGEVARMLRAETFLGSFEVPSVPNRTLNLFSNPQGAALAALQDAATPATDVYSVLWLHDADGRTSAFAASAGHVPGMTLTDARGLLTFFGTVNLLDNRWKQAASSLLDAMETGRFWAVPEYRPQRLTGKLLATSAKASSELSQVS